MCRLAGSRGEDALAQAGKASGRRRDRGVAAWAACLPCLGGGPHEVVVPGLDEVLVEVHGWFPFRWRAQRAWPAVVPWSRWPGGPRLRRASAAGVAAWLESC